MSEVHFRLCMPKMCQNYSSIMDGLKNKYALVDISRLPGLKRRAFELLTVFRSFCDPTIPITNPG